MYVCVIIWTIVYTSLYSIRLLAAPEFVTHTYRVLLIILKTLKI